MKRTVVTLLVLALAASAALAAPPILRVRAASLDAVVQDISAASLAVGHPVQRETTLAALAFALSVPDLSFVDPTKPLALGMPMEGMLAGPKGMVAVLPVKDRAKSIAALAQAFAGHTFDGGVHTFTAEDADTRLYAREAEGVLITGPTRELLAAIDPAEALSGKDLPAGSLVLTVEIEPIAPLLASGFALGRRAITEGPPKPPPGPDGTEAAVPPPLPKEIVPLLDVYFDLLQDGIDNVSRVQLALSVEGGSILVRTRLVAKKDSALGAFCAAQVLTGSVAATRAVPDDAPLRLAGRIQWTPEALTYLSDYSGRFMDALRTAAGEAEPAVVQQLDAWLEMWDMTGPSRMMQCSRGDFAVSMGYRPDGKQTMLEAFGLETTQACAEVLEAQLERVRSKGTLRESLVEETLEPQKLKTSVMKYTSPAFAVSGTPPGAAPEEVVVRMAQADDLFLLGLGEGSADAFRAVLARRPPAKDARVPTSPSFVTGHLDVGTMLKNAPADASEAPSLRAFADRLQGSAGKIVVGMRFLDAAADFELGIPLGLLDAMGKAVAAEAKKNTEDEDEELEEEP
ncbi:MAG TPA: hypothetical protein VFV75_01330 [Candidatus Polarisedimenticolaceae bacterium]|nr:hypothetical protein [Candidatus Polarisedimenticolaceae bacterium]